MADIWCSNCNHFIPEDSTFCPRCGVRIEKKSNMIICSKCGAELTIDSLFCSKCGNKITRDSEQNAMEEPKSTTSVDSEVKEENRNPISPNPPTISVDNELNKKQVGHKATPKNLIFIIFAIVILIVAVFLFTVFILPNRVEISQQSFTLTEGESLSIDVNQIPKFSTVFPVKIINKHEEVATATLQNGKCNIVAISPGQCTLLFQSINGKNASCYITVKARSTPLPTLSATPSPANIADDYSVNDKFSHLSFDGSTLDPCGFLSIHNILNHKISYYLEGLAEGEDYNVKKYTANEYAPGFRMYELYPIFSYLGVEPGYTAIEIDTDESGNNITSFAYLFLVTSKNAHDVIQEGYSNLNSTYGSYDTCTYTSMQYSKMGIQDIRLYEFFNLLDNDTEGLYHIQWITRSGMRITLGVTLDPQYQYYQCEVAYAIP